MTERKQKKDKLKKASSLKSPAIAKSSSVLDRISANARVITICIFVIAGLIRFGYVFEVVNGPLGTISTFENSDANFFDQWSKKIREGDLLGKEAFHPLHNWHLNSANYYFQEKGFNIPSQELEAKSQELWNKWYGGNTFHQEPLYAYFNALLYSVSSGKHTIVFFFQVILSLLSLLLIMRLTKIYFNELAAITAGVLFALYGPSIFYDGILLRTSAITTATLAMVYFFERTSSGETKNYIAFGLVSGIAFLLKSTLILLFFSLLIYKFWFTKPKVKIIKPLAISCLALLVILSPLMIRNASVGAPLMSSSSVGPVTFINSNFEGYIPTEGFLVDHTKTTRILEETDGKLLATISASIKGFSSFGKFIGLQFKKAVILFDNHEIPNNFNYYLHKKYSTILNVGFLSYAFILGLGLVGIFMYVKRKTLNGLIICIFIQAAVLVGFYIVSRFRLPLAVCLIPFAAFTLSEIFNKWDVHRSKAMKLGAISLSLIIVFSFMPTNPKTKFRRTDPSLLFTNHYLPILNSTPVAEFYRCAELLQEILDKGPDHIVNYKRGNLNSNERKLADFYAAIYTDLGGIYKELKQPTQQRAAEQMAGKIYRAIGK